MKRTPIPDHIRRTAVADYYRGEQTAAQVAARYGIPRSTFGAWVGGGRKDEKDDLALTNGRWVGGLVKRWEPNPPGVVPEPEPAPLRAVADLIACPTCRATVNQSCRVVSGKLKGRRKGPHKLRLTGRLCACGARLAPKHQLCDRCAAESTRESKRAYMRRKRATEVAA